MIAGDFSPSFELQMARKDVRLMIETAGALPLGVLPGMAARMDALIAEGHGAEDLAVMGEVAARPEYRLPRSGRWTHVGRARFPPPRQCP